MATFPPRLRSLAIPLYLAKVDPKFRAVELFSLWPIWLIFWRQAEPFEIILSTQQPGTSDFWKEPQSSLATTGVGKGDGAQWTVDLGPPILRLTNEELADANFKARVTSVLQTWVATERANLIRYQQFIPFVVAPRNWSTNMVPTEAVQWQFWARQPGANIDRVSQVAAPVLTSLGTHLQWQDNPDAYKLIEVLEWLNQRGSLDAMGQGLLEGLKRTKSQGVGPAHELPKENS